MFDWFKRKFHKTLDGDFIKSENEENAPDQTTPVEDEGTGKNLNTVDDIETQQIELAPVANDSPLLDDAFNVVVTDLRVWISAQDQEVVENHLQAQNTTEQHEKLEGYNIRNCRVVLEPISNSILEENQSALNEQEDIFEEAEESLINEVLETSPGATASGESLQSVTGQQISEAHNSTEDTREVFDGNCTDLEPRVVEPLQSVTGEQQQPLQVAESGQEPERVEIAENEVPVGRQDGDQPVPKDPSVQSGSKTPSDLFSEDNGSEYNFDASSSLFGLDKPIHFFEPEPQRSAEGLPIIIPRPERILTGDDIFSDDDNEFVFESSEDEEDGEAPSGTSKAFQPEEKKRRVN